MVSGSLHFPCLLIVQFSITVTKLTRPGNETSLEVALTLTSVLRQVVDGAQL